MNDTIDPPNPGPGGMIVDPVEGRSKSPSILLPNPIEGPFLPPPPPPLPPPSPLTQAGRPMRNYKQPARYIDINPEPLRPLNEEPPPSTSILPLMRSLTAECEPTTTNFSFFYERESFVMQRPNY